MPTSKSADQLRDDFDRIARLSEPVWSHNSHYHADLLRHVSPRIERALDIGCGTGTFARMLADRADQVVGIDLSPVMIERAKAESGATMNIRYEVADVMQVDYAPESFDCIASIATLHHMDLSAVLERIKTWLKPGGVLLVIDLVKSEGLEYAIDAAALPISRVIGLIKNGRPQPEPDAGAAWESHGRAETYLTMRDVRAAAVGLTGALIQRRLFFRYTLVWRKPK